MEQIDVVYRIVDAHPDVFEIALTANDVERIHRQGKIASLIGMEGGHSINNSLANLRMFYMMGARYMTITHSRNTDWADSATDEPRHNGLTRFGELVIKEMNRLGMVINISHASDETVAQALETSADPIVATHHGMRSLNDIPRNMPDDLIKKLAAKGGVIGFQIGNDFHNRKFFEWRTRQERKAFWDTSKIGEREARLSIEEIDRIVAPKFPMVGFPAPEDLKLTVHDWVAVVDRAIQLAGEDHVALGTDFDGGPTPPRGMRDIRDLPMITEAMLRRGYTEERIRKFLGGNLLRVFRQVVT